MSRASINLHSMFFGSGWVAGQARQRRMIVDLDAVADFDPHSTFSSA
jgi:hypothetical protein